MTRASTRITLTGLVLGAAVSCGSSGSSRSSSSSHTDSGARDAIAGDARSDAKTPDADAVHDAARDTAHDTADVVVDARSAEAGSRDAGAPYTWAPKPCSFYVAASGGSDTNPGTSALPFATLTALRSALRTATPTNKVGCLKAGSGGSYLLPTPQAPLVLAATLDDGETWESDPAGGVNSAVLDGDGSASCLIRTDANNITIDGLKLQHTTNNLTCHDDGTTSISNLTILNSDIGFNAAGTGSGGFPPCLMANGAKGVTLKHNYVHDCASQGIGLFAYQAGLVLDDVVIDSNVVLRAVQSVPDGGAIYMIMVHNYTASSVVVSNNFVRDYGTATVSRAHGIYFDEGSNHVVAKGNVIGAATAGSKLETGCLIADGHDNRFEGNICDVGTTGFAWTGVWWYPGNELFTPENNTYTGNVVVSRFAGNQETSAYNVSGPSFVQIASPAGDPVIRGNLFHNYGGGQVRTDGNHVSDADPVLADPLCSGSEYTLASGSPAFNAPVSFEPIVGGWGPPGFVVPPDVNRSCP